MVIDERAIRVAVREILAVVGRAVAIAIHFAGVRDAVPVAISLAIIWDAIAIAVVPIDFTFIRDRIAVAIFDGAGIHIASATLDPRTTNASTEAVGDIIQAQQAILIRTRQAASPPWCAGFLRTEASCS